MNKNNFHILALFSLMAFSSANSYSMLRRSIPQISALPFMALRHCSTSSTTQQEIMTITETPKVEFKYSNSRMHPEDMKELKKYLLENSKYEHNWEAYTAMLTVTGFFSCTALIILKD
ncbi:MAG TPA: hypothetical protein VLG50_04710 [Candidatus Saccharimonadales bacterium]|nr:hypothetical protein [Candidatus Saccharimonadales bacterium]